MKPYDEPRVLTAVQDIKALFEEAGVTPILDKMVYAVRMQYDHDAGMPWDQSVRKHLNEVRDELGLPHPEAPAPQLWPLTLDNGRLRTEAGYTGIRCVTEFSLPYRMRIGDEGEVVRRLDRCVANGANAARMLMMAKNMFPLYRPDWDAASRAVVLAAERGLYTEACLFADAQDLFPSSADRQVIMREFGDWCAAHPTVIPQVANEPFKNGWTGATDPALLYLAQMLEARLGTRLFSIGDPNDYVEIDPATGKPYEDCRPLRGWLELLAERSHILVLHAERKGKDSRYAGWVDHLKGFDEVYDNPLKKFRWHDEPMGAASTYQDGRRDDRADAHRAAILCAAVMGMGYTYHYISEQDDATPGMDGFLLSRQISQDPSYRFHNAGTGGAVKSFDVYDKVRTCDNGADGWAVGYGHAKGRLIPYAGWSVELLNETDHVALWRTKKEG